MSLYYSAFGGRVCSDVPFPELPSADEAAADWTLRCMVKRPSQPVGRLLGKVVKGDCKVSLWSTESGYRLRHSCVGEYDISHDGSRIDWWRESDAADVMIQNDVVGRILPLIFHVRGALCLHASAVAIDRTALAFVADARVGKSTLAYSLVRAGAQLVSDDAVILETQPGVVMRRGVEHIRLRRDASERLARDGVAQRSPLDGKNVVRLGETSRVRAEELPLGGIYLLASARRGESPVRREFVQPRAATMLLMRHARMGRVLCGADGGEMLRRAASVTQQVPVYALHVARDLARINEVAEQLIEWHAHSLMATGTNG